MAKLKYKLSYREEQKHIHDDYTELGYDYENEGILKNAISPELYANPLNDSIFAKIEELLSHVVNAVKYIKLQFAFALPKNSKLLN